MLVESHVLSFSDTLQPPLSLKVAAKRYRVEDASDDGVTLLLAHGSGFHKEHWEPTLDGLFLLESKLKDSQRNVKIREAWALDWQGHGESAVLNEDQLNSDEVVSIGAWGRALADFIQTGSLKCPIILIGHSAGTSAAMYSTKFFPRDQCPYSAIILIEPPMITREVFDAHLEERMKQIEYLKGVQGKRKSRWPDRVSALEYFSQREPWKKWDRRVLNIYVEYGLKATPDGRSVMLKCPPAREAASYADLEPTFEATAQIAAMCRLVPIHFIFGAKKDLVPRYSQDSLTDRSKGYYPASVHRMDNLGHLIVEEAPDRLASALYEILSSELSIPRGRL